MPQSLSAPQKSYTGLIQAFSAYGVWCLFPLYFSTLSSVPPFEIVVWRLFFTLPFCLIIILANRQLPALIAVLSNPRLIGMLAISGLCIGTNWLIYVVAAMDGHILAASLGYYINPLVNILAGTLFLNETLTRRQWIAVGLAAFGVALLAQGALDTLWVSLTMAFSFSAYGLVRKLAPVDAITGLTVETILLMLPGLGLLAWQANSDGGLAIAHSAPLIVALLLMAGPLTAVPLMLFASAARKLDFSILGFIQFVTPTGLFAMSVFVFKEPLQPIQLVCFLFIWAAIAVFCWDILSRRRKPSERACEA